MFVISAICAIQQKAAKIQSADLHFLAEWLYRQTDYKLFLFVAEHNVKCWTISVSV